MLSSGRDLQKRQGCLQTIKKADVFGQEFSFLLENRKSRLQSLFGVFAGILMIILLIAYGITRLQTMLDFGDNVIQEPNEERYFDLDFTFDQDYGFSVAFGLTTYDQNDEVYDDSYGRVVAKQKIWGEKDENGQIKPLYFRDLETGPCDRSLFLFGDEDDDESKAIFFQASSDYLSDVKRILPKL